MTLTQAQKAALKADLAANTNTVLIGGIATPIKNIVVGEPLDTTDNWFAVAAWYSQLAAPAYYGWNTAVGVATILNATTFADFTPSDLPPTAANPSAPTAAETYALQLWTARSLVCQGKQFNYEIMLQGRTTIDASLGTLRAGIKDACANLPSGVGGAIQNAGYSNGILPILSRQASNIEKLFATGSGTNDANASTFAIQGAIDGPTVLDAAANG